MSSAVTLAPTFADRQARKPEPDPSSSTFFPRRESDVR